MRPRRTTASSPIFVPSHTSGAGMSEQQKRRRDVLFVLLGLVAFTFFLAVLTRSMAFIALQIVADLALAGYVYLLLQYKQRATGQRQNRLGAGFREGPQPGALARREHHRFHAGCGSSANRQMARISSRVTGTTPSLRTLALPA